MVEKQAEHILELQKMIMGGINKILDIHANDKYKFETFSVLNMHQAAELLNISQSTLLEACINGELPCRKIGTKYIFLRDTLITWLNLDEPKVDIKDSIDSEVAAELLGVPVAKIRQWSKGYYYYKIPVIRKGNKFVYDKDQLLEWAETPEFKKLKDEYLKNCALNEKHRIEAEAWRETERLRLEAEKKARIEKNLQREV